MLQQAAALIEQRTGLSVNTRHPNDFNTIMLELSEGQLAVFINQLRQDALTAPSWQSVIRALAIGETYFFRDETHFRILKTQILPALILQRRQQHNLTLNLWSVGCATGEEPYSLAIALFEALPDLPRWKINLSGTDINQHALETARRAVYRPWSFRRQELNLTPYFDRIGDTFQLKSHIREMVTFRQGNILDGAPVPQIDLIFCRNVLLYFTPEHGVDAEAVLREALSPGGWLFLGHSETVRGENWIKHQFPGAPIYQKPPATKSPPPPAAPVVHDTPATYAEAVRAYHEERYVDAKAMLEQLAVDFADDACVWTMLACLAADHHHPEAAHQHLDTALALNPLLADAHYLRALLHQEAGEPQAMQHALRGALYCQRDHALAAFTLATVYADAGGFDRAVKLWETARDAVADLPNDQYLADISEMTAGVLRGLIGEYLAAWKN